MNRNTVIGIIALLIILGGITFYASTKPLTGKAPDMAGTIILPEGGYSEHATYYDIVANYATSTPLRGRANTAAIAQMKDFVGGTIAQFKVDGNFANLTQEDIAMMGFDEGRKQALTIVYLISSSPRTVSYIFTIYVDTLGAHGNTFFHTFTFDTVTGEPRSLRDVFSPGAEYLEKLSGIARAKLPSVIGQDYDMTFIKGGTTPEDKSFEDFFLDNGELVILFAPYQVAPYAAGPQTLRIEVSELASILRPEYK